MFSEDSLRGLVGLCTPPLLLDITSCCAIFSACAACLLVLTPFIVLIVSVSELF